MLKPKPTLGTLALLVALVLGPFTPPRVLASAPKELQLRAYQALVKADGARAQNNSVLAIDQYRRAIHLYRELQEQAPDYKSSIVDYGLTYCTNQLGSLNAEVTNRPTPSVSPEQKKGNKIIAEAPKTESNRRNTLARSNGSLSPAQPLKVTDEAANPTKDRYTSLTASGNAKLKLRNIHEAMADFKAAITMDPKRSNARLGMAACYHILSNIAKAREIVEQVLSDKSNNPQALGLLGIICWKEGDLKQANRLLNKALYITQTDPQLYNYFGVILNTQGQPKQALQSFAKAVSLDPNYREAHFNLAVLYATRESQNLSVARNHYAKALTLGSQGNDVLEQFLTP